MATATGTQDADEALSFDAASATAPRFEHAARLYASVAGVLGVLGLAGWWWEIPALLSIVPGFAPMQCGTSVGLMVAAVCVFLLCGEPVSRVRRIPAAVLALYLIAWGGIVIYYRVAGLPVPDQGVLRALFLAEPYPGVASAATGVGFLLLGASFAELGRVGFGPGRAQPLALAGLTTGVVGIAGYLYDPGALYSVEAYDSMALTGAIGFVLLFTSILLCRPRTGWVAIFAGDGSGNVLARRVLPVAILFPFISGWIFLLAVGGGHVPLPFGIAALTVVSAILLSGIVWRTAHNVALADTARLGTARALRRSDHLRSAVFEAVLDPIITLDRDGRVIEVNMAARRLLGSHMRGGRIESIFADEAAMPELPRPWDGEIALNQRTEAILRRADGSPFPAEISVSQTWPDGRQTLVLHIRDLTEQRAIETELRQAQKMEAVGQLTGGLAHDFNNILAIILGNLDLLHERLDQQRFKDEFVAPAVAAAERGAQLTQRLLAFGRRQSLQPAVTDVNELVGGMADMLRRTLGQGVEIRTQLDEALWPTRIDPGQLENALINLAINARDAMEGAGLLTIETRNVLLDEDYVQFHPDAEPGAYIGLIVADTGKGMAPEIAARAFEPFFTTKEIGKGTGLGLSMVYGFIRQSGGYIDLASEPKQGTVVALYLPRSDDAAGVEEGIEAISLPMSAGERVLVVEDDPDLLAVTTGMMEDLGYRTLIASDAREALVTLDARRDVDLLFTDLVLPGGINGIELAEQARIRRPALRVVYTSGYAETALSARSPKEDITVLQKPFRRADLARTLRQALAAEEQGT